MQSRRLLGAPCLCKHFLTSSWVQGQYHFHFTLVLYKSLMQRQHWWHHFTGPRRQGMVLRSMSYSIHWTVQPGFHFSRVCWHCRLATNRHDPPSQQVQDASPSGCSQELTRRRIPLRSSSSNFLDIRYQGCCDCNIRDWRKSSCLWELQSAR